MVLLLLFVVRKVALTFEAIDSPSLEWGSSHVLPLNGETPETDLLSFSSLLFGWVAALFTLTLACLTLLSCCISILTVGEPDQGFVEIVISRKENCVKFDLWKLKLILFRKGNFVLEI
ncbi:hypothetical protein NC652_009908 [Populus alba x Populus x berolinensis]|nr:hypothetical protein NC652_009908 [Populus alba x Populus x berolinensis]